MTTTNYINSGYITKMGDSSTNDGTAGRPVDGIDFPHSGLIKTLNVMASTGYPVLNAHVGSGSHNFNMDMDDTTSSGYTTITVRAGMVIREGVAVSVPQATITEIATPPITADRQFIEQGSAGENFYHVIVVADGTGTSVGGGNETANQIYIRNPSAKDIVADLTNGDIPIALLRVQNSETPTARHLQYLGTDVQSNSLSIAYDNSGVYTEAMNIKSDSNGDVTIKNVAQDKDIIFNVNDGGSDTEVMRIEGSNACVGIGTNTPTEKLHLADADGAEPSILIENTGTAAGEPQIIFYRSTGTGADSRDIGHIKFWANDTAGNLHTFAQMYVDQSDADSGTEDGRMIFDVSQAGTDGVEHFRIQGGSVVVNETGADIDFRVEGDTATNLLCTDAGNDTVGINTSPENSARFHVEDDGSKSFTLLLESTDTDANIGPTLALWRNSASPANGDDCGGINWYFETSTGARHLLGRLRSEVNEVTTGSEDSRLYFSVFKAGSEVQTVTMKYNEVVINDGSNDIDFRVEGNGDANLLFAEAGTDKVGIGTNSPATLLDVDGDLACQGFKVNVMEATAVGPPSPPVMTWTMDANDNIIILINSTSGGVPSFDGVLPSITSADIGRIYEFDIVDAAAPNAVGLTMPSGTTLTDKSGATLASAAGTYSITTAGTYLRIFAKSTSEYRVINA